MADKYERFVAAFLRLNAYFCVPNFIVHAGDDVERISSGQVGNHTEADLLGVRMPHSEETTGNLTIVNYLPLTDGSSGKFDVVIVEVKSGNDTRPNRVWRARTPHNAIAYIVRFVGLHREPDVARVSDSLATTYRYEDDRCRVRYMVFAHEANEHYERAGVTYLTFRDAIRFLVNTRGQCWIDSNIGVASVHQQWDELLVAVFAIASRNTLTVDGRTDEIERYLAV